MRGWLLSEQGQEEQGIAQMRRGLDAWQLMGIEVGQPYWLAYWPRHMHEPARLRKLRVCSPRRCFWYTKMRRAGGRRSCIGSRGRYC